MNKDQISSFYNGVFQFVPNITKKTKKNGEKLNDLQFGQPSVIFDPHIMSQQNVEILQSKPKKIKAFPTSDLR